MDFQQGDRDQRTTRNNRNMNGLRFLYVVLGLMMIVNVHQVRSDGEISDEEIDDELLNGASSSSEEDDNHNKGIEYYLNAVKGLHQQRKRQEAEPLVASRNSASTPIAALYRRSALNKNFIRFGRSGMMKTASRQVQPTPPVRYIAFFFFYAFFFVAFRPLLSENLISHPFLTRCSIDSLIKNSD